MAKKKTMTYKIPQVRQGEATLATVKNVFVKAKDNLSIMVTHAFTKAKDASLR